MVSLVSPLELIIKTNNEKEHEIKFQQIIYKILNSISQIPVVIEYKDNLKNYYSLSYQDNRIEYEILDEILIQKR